MFTVFLNKEDRISFSKNSITGYIILSRILNTLPFKDPWTLLYTKTDFFIYYWFKLIRNPKKFSLDKNTNLDITIYKSKNFNSFLSVGLKKLNFFLYTIFFKKKKKIDSSELINSFWPSKNTILNILHSITKISKFSIKGSVNFCKYLRNLKKKKKKPLFLILNKFKQQKKKLKNSNFFLKYKKNLIKKFNSTRRLQSRKGMTRFHNFHRGLIKLFWKSQEFFKEHYSIKRRWTAKKFKYFFLNWYKRADLLITTPNSAQNTRIPVIWLLSYLGFFLSKKDTSQAIDSGLVTLNGKYFFNPNQNLFVSDILGFYKNFYYNFETYNSKKNFFKKKFNKKQYILYKNKASQWRQVKKKKPKEAQITLFRKNKYPNWLHYNFLTSSIALIKNPHSYKNNFMYLTRHNLEKLNTWKLTI